MIPRRRKTPKGVILATSHVHICPLCKDWKRVMNQWCKRTNQGGCPVVCSACRKGARIER